MEGNSTNNFSIEQQDSSENNESTQTLKPCCCYRLVLSHVESLLANAELANLRLMQILERQENATDRLENVLKHFSHLSKIHAKLLEAQHIEQLKKLILEECDRRNGERTVQ